MKASWIFNISFFLFFLSFYGSFHKKTSKVPFLLYKKITNYNLNLEQKKFLLGSLTGYKLFGPNTFLLQTGITHLLTPSGLHLLPFKKILNQRFYIFLVSIFFGFTEGFFSLKRILIFKIFRSFSFSSTLSFILTFILSFMTHFIKSPFSFTLSFLFFGLLLSKKSILEPFKTFWYFFQGQVLVLYLFHLPFYPSSIFLNPILTFLFLRLYPYFLINFWLSIFLVQDIFLEKTVSYFFLLGQCLSSHFCIVLDFLDVLLIFYPKTIYIYAIFFSKNLF